MSYEFEANIEKVTNDLDLGSDVEEAAKDLMKEILDMDYTRKFTPYGGFDAMVAMAVYTAAHQERKPVDPEIFEDYFRDSDDFDVTKHFHTKKIRDVKRMLFRELDLPKIVYKPSDFVYKSKRHLEMDDESWRMVDRLLENMDDQTDLTGKSPKALAGASIYIVSVLNDQGITQSDVKNVLSLSKVAIRYTYKEIISALTELDTENLTLSDVEITATTLGIEEDLQ